MWRIDTIDPRGGLSFVSWREETLFGDGPLEDAPVFYIGAPSFTPVAVANRSVALAAERQGFQLGLLDDEGEVAFETLDEVAEFMRRLYLSNSRGDSADGGAAPPLPRPEGGSPPEAGEPIIDSPLSGAVADFVQLSRNQQRGRSALAEWEIALRGGAGLQTLAHGAEILMLELLYRFPTDSAGLERWRASSVRLASIVGRLGLSRIMRSKTIRAACRHFLDEEWSRFEPVNVSSDGEAVAAALMVMAHQTHWHYWHGAPGIGNGTGMDPMDELSALPLPERLVVALNLPPETASSAATVVSATLGSPALMAGAPELEAILLLAACRIVAFDGSPHVASTAATWPHFNWDDATHDVRFTALLEAAREWLQDNLPNRVFHPEVEAMIDAIAPTLYHTPEGGGAPQQADRQTRGGEDAFAAFGKAEAMRHHEAEQSQQIGLAYGEEN